MLLASPVPVRRIVSGKFTSALFFLLLTLAASLPIVWIILPLGGVAGEEVVGLYANLAILCALFAVASITCSAYFHRTHSALVVSYLAILPMAALLVAIAWQSDARVFGWLGWLEFVAVFVAVATYACLGLVEHRVVREISEPPRPAGEEDPDEQIGLVLRRGCFPDVLLLPEKGWNYIDDGENPVYRKELRSELLGTGTLFARVVLQVALLLSILFIPQIVTGHVNYFCAYLVVVVALIGPALSAGAFSQERERGTLDSLLCTLLRPRQVVLGKLCSLARYTLVLVGVLVVAHVVTYLFSLRMERGSVLASLDQTAAHALVLVTTALATVVLSGFYSLLTMRTFSATMLTYVTLLFFYLGPLVAYRLAEMVVTVPVDVVRWVTFTSPFGPLFLAPGQGILASPPALWHAFVLFWTGLAVVLLRLCLGRWRRLSTGA
jgi:ABC-type transport system involved in multi-copper enzyme maturation permease subunit